jgi:hypothetical protein
MTSSRTYVGHFNCSATVEEYARYLQMTKQASEPKRGHSVQLQSHGATAM